MCERFAGEQQAMTRDDAKQLLTGGAPTLDNAAVEQIMGSASVRSLVVRQTISITVL